MNQPVQPAQLQPTEQFLWDVARHWRDRSQGPDPTNLDWPWLVDITRTNRMQNLLVRYLEDHGWIDRAQNEYAAALQREAQERTKATMRLKEALVSFLQAADDGAVEAVVLKGLWLSEKIYGDATMRPGGDIDILVRQGQIQTAFDVLESIGIGEFWPNLLDDVYYDRHHLHHQRSSDDLQVWFEIHWALDHPYTTLTIDYEALMDRTTEATIFGQPVLALSSADLLLSQAVHLVKHAVYLPSLLEREDLDRVILADGMLMYYLDIAQTLEAVEPALDWQELVELAHDWGAGEILGSVLRVCQRYLGSPVPEAVVHSLPVKGLRGPARWVLNKMAEYENATHAGMPASGWWDFMVVTNGAFVLRPIRLIDSGAYVFPSAEFLRRRYGKASLFNRTLHFVRASLQFARLMIDTLLFGWMRYRRLKALNQSTSLFNRLDVEA